MRETLAAWVTGGRRGVAALRAIRRAQRREARRAELLADWPDVTKVDVDAAVRDHFELQYPDTAAAGRALGVLVRHFERSGIAFESALLKAARA